MAHETMSLSPASAPVMARVSSSSAPASASLEGQIAVLRQRYDSASDGSRQKEEAFRALEKLIFGI